MKKKWSKLLGTLCYTAGVFFALYIGGWIMMIQPAKTLVVAISFRKLTLPLLVKNLILILLSTTVGGFLWCIGYVGYNFFKGDEDPDWDTLEMRWREKKKEKEQQENT